MSYNLNEALKKQAAEKQHESDQENGSVRLDDLSRVKVLSPGRRVFKRFIRNRLAVCICMLRALRSLFYIHFLFTGQIRFHLRWNSFIFSVYLVAHSLGVVSAVRHAQQTEPRSFRLTSDCTLPVLYHPVKSETIFPHQTILYSQTPGTYAFMLQAFPV